MVDQFSSALLQGSSLAFALAFFSGILASLTPCIYPVIPITVGFFSGRAKTHRQAIWLSIVYVLGMTIVYAALGVFAALTGKVFGRITMNPPVYIIVGGLILLFGIMQLWGFSFRPPSFLSRFHVSDMTEPVSRWGWAPAAFVMGLTSGFIVAPCTVPILGVILTYIATRQSLIFGASLMFSFALGLGVLLMFLGIFTGFVTRLPKSGRWLVRIEKGTGLLFLFIGLYFIYRGIYLI